MSYNGNVISAPVRIADVKTALGMRDNSLGDLIYDGAENENINIFAKYKPVVYDPSVSGKYGVLSDTDRRHTYTKTVGLYPCTIRHGLAIPQGADYNVMVENPSTSPGVLRWAQWEYDYPTGGQYRPYRLSDFNGYAPKAVCPIAFYTDAGGTIAIPQSGNGTIMTFLLRINQAVGGSWSSSTCLSFSDLFSSLSNYYFTVHMMCRIRSGSLTRVFRYTKSGQTVYSIMQNNYIGMVQIDTKDLKTIFSGTDAIKTGASWTAGMMLTSRGYAGSLSDHEMGSGCTVVRLEYKENVDRRILTVKETTWVDKINTLEFQVRMNKRSGYTNHYYISYISVDYDVDERIPCAVDIEYFCPSGYISGVTEEDGILRISDSITMVNSGEKTYNNTTIQTDFVTTTTFPDGSQIGAVTLKFTYNGSSISKTVNMRLNTVTTSKTFSATVIDNT